MRRILIATLASLALGLPMLAAPAAHAQTEDTTAAAAPMHHARHHRHRHHRHHHHAMTAGRPDLSGSAGTGTSMRDTTGAQTSLPSAISNQAPGAAAR
ncbi:MAG: hypothetical protein ACRYG6_02270 [Janthinobacterium lividum]